MKNKYIKMIKVVAGVLFNKSKIINTVIPDSYKKNIKEIDYEKLKQLKIKNLIFDIDNTITKVDDKNIDKEIIDFFQNLKLNEFNIMVMSNNHEERVIPVAKALDVPYLADAKKPNKEAYEKALKILKCKKEEIAMIGDQMLSDVVGANEYEIYSILVDQLSQKNNIQTGTAKFLQDMIVKKLKNKNLFNYNNYY